MEDRRIKRTKRFLSMALVELLREKPINQITVKELTERSDVNRATFYRHYQDIYNMLGQMQQELFEGFSRVLEQEPPPTDDAARERLYFRILSFVSEHAELCGILFGSNGDRGLLQRLEQQVLEFCGLCFDEDDPAAVRYSAIFLAAGFIGVVEQWLTDGMQMPPDELAAHIVSSTRKGFSVGLLPARQDGQEA